MKIENKEMWLIGLLEASSSFAINIGIRENKTNKFITLQPVVSMNTIDKDQIEIIQEILKIDSNSISKKQKTKNSSDTFILNIQNYEDIEKIFDLISNNDGFNSERKHDSFIYFKDAFEYIKEIGYRHISWKPEIELLIDKKLKINKRKSLDKKRLTKEAWVKRIQEHLLT